MRILFVSNNYPPEVNAPATRLAEHAAHWVESGHEVVVLTGPPHFPEGRVYEGFRNRFSDRVEDGVRVIRIPMYVTANEGTFKRILSYLSFMLSGLLYARRLRSEYDVLVATSPQFFAGVLGYLLSRRFRLPFVLEIRDLWPESIVAVGAMRRNFAIRMLERLEHFLYRSADHIVVVTNSFKDFIVGKGITPGKISVIMNGVDVSRFSADVSDRIVSELEDKIGARGRFIAAYVGTIGMAHSVDTVLEAAQRSDDPGILFLVVGAGAERESLARRSGELCLPNFVLLEKLPRHYMPSLMSTVDVSIVHLRRSDVFETVIPSKIFESMAAGKPIVLGVGGESRDLVEKAEAGIPVTPEDPLEMLEAVQRLKDDAGLYGRMQERARLFAAGCDRVRLAGDYATLLNDVATSSLSATRQQDHLDRGMP